MEWLTLTITLLLVMDPFGNIPALIGLLETVAPQRRRRVILRECLIALGLLLLFLFAGPRLMSLLGLDQPALNIAGGVVLVLIALRMLFPSKGGVMGEEAIEGEPLIVPIATPLIAGPSAVATVVLIHSTSSNWFTNGMIAVGGAWGITTLVLLLSPEVIKLLGKRVLIAAERLTGLLLTVIAVQMILGGIKMFMDGLS
ncbi:MAG: MarC family protein [Planctomycetota bacterium]